MAHRVRRARAGVTLIEILLVIAIIGLLGAGIGFGASNLPLARMQSESQLVAALCRGAYVHALTTGHTTRVSFQLKSNTIVVEETNDAHTLDPRDPKKAGGAEAVEASVKDDKDSLLKDPRPRARRASFSPVSRPALRARELRGGVRFLKLFSQHDEDPREEGMGAVYFFPGGDSERAMIQLTNSRGDIFTVVVHPYTGRVEVLSRAVEPIEQEEPARDDVDVDLRDKPQQQDSDPQ